jgi:hypothetical protein
MAARYGARFGRPRLAQATGLPAMRITQRRYGCDRDRAAVKERGSVAFVPRRRRCIDICPTAKPEAFENGRFISKTGRSRKVSASRRAAAVRRIPAVCGTEIERQGSTQAVRKLARSICS